VKPFCRFLDSKWAPACATVLLLTGIAFVLLRSVIDPRGEVDFRFFWLAGKLWANGLDPYSESFRAIGAQILPPGNTVLYWFYPPQWWIVSRTMALLDLEQAVMVWRLVNSALVLLGTALVVASLERDSRRRRIAMVLWGGVALLIEPTANLLAFGQSAGFVYLSLSMLVAGALRRRRWLVGLAVLLVTFKPQVGVIVLLWVFLVPSFRIAALAGLGSAGLLTLPHVIQFGVFGTIDAYLANAARWADLPSNTALTSSGPAGLLARLGVEGVGLLWQTLAATALAVCAARLMRRQPTRPIPSLLLLTAGIASLMPLHIYDLTILLIPLILLTTVAACPAWVLAAVIILVSRPGKAEMLLGVQQYSSDVSAGLIGLGVAGLILLVFAVREALPGFASGSPADGTIRAPDLESVRFS